MRCTRRCKDGSNFCGKHINNQKYGCVKDLEGGIIELDEINYEKETYLIDIENIVYKKESDDTYSIIGKKVKNGSIYFIDS